MNYYKISCEEFTDLVFSKAPAPGGGGVAALAGALGIALGGMVCSLTLGKEKYAVYENDIQQIINKAESAKERFLQMMNEDAENFTPLANAYRLPSATEEERKIKQTELERCLKIALATPIEIIEKAYETIDLLEELSIKGNTTAISDIGCGIALIRSALSMSLLNTLINLNMIKDEEYIKEIKSNVLPLVERGIESCDKIYIDVLKVL